MFEAAGNSGFRLLGPIARLSRMTHF
jgi:hypothetical protein